MSPRLVKPDDHLMPIDNFVRDCEDGCLIDYDGFGYWATQTQISAEVVRPSFVCRRTRSDGEYPVVETDYKCIGEARGKGYTHVVWFNR